MNKINIQQWRIINMIVIIVGLFMPWMVFYFDINVAQEMIIPQSGWEYFYYTWWENIDAFLTYGFELFMWSLWLEGFCGVILILYLIFNAFSIVKIRKNIKGRVISFILFGVFIFLLSLVFSGGKLLLGYWLTILGIFSSIVVEWQGSMIKNGVNHESLN